jgi:hypothetical protein
MNRLILLDSGPLGMVTNPKAKGLPFACQQWLKTLVIIATTNVGHLSRFTTALNWQDID